MVSIIELDDGKIYRKALYLMVKTMVSCRFSLKSIQCFQASGWRSAAISSSAAFHPGWKTHQISQVIGRSAWTILDLQEDCLVELASIYSYAYHIYIYIYEGIIIYICNIIIIPIYRKHIFQSTNLSSAGRMATNFNNPMTINDLPVGPLGLTRLRQSTQAM